MSAERPRSADLRAAEPASPMADSHCSRHGSRRGYVLQRVRCSVPDLRSRGLMNVHARKTQKAVGGTCMVSGAWAMASHAGAKESRVIMYDDVATKKTTLWCSADSANTCWTDTPHGGGAVPTQDMLHTRRPRRSARPRARLPSARCPSRPRAAPLARARGRGGRAGRAARGHEGHTAPRAVAAAAAAAAACRARGGRRCPRAARGGRWGRRGPPTQKNRPPWPRARRAATAGQLARAAEATEW